MNAPKITKGLMTLSLVAAIVEDQYEDYCGDLTPAVSMLITAYGATPDGEDDFLGLAEEDSILMHTETGALLIAGLLDHPYVAESLEGKIRIVTTSHPEDEDIIGELECVPELDADVETINGPSFDGDAAEVILKGTVTLDVLHDIACLSWVSEVTVL